MPPNPNTQSRGLSEILLSFSDQQKKDDDRFGDQHHQRVEMRRRPIVRQHAQAQYGIERQSVEELGSARSASRRSGTASNAIKDIKHAP